MEVNSSNDYFARWLSGTLDNLAWSHAELARHVGVHDSVVGRWVAGKTRPSIENAQEVGVALGEPPFRVAATAGYPCPGYEPLPLPPPLGERARVERQMQAIHGLPDAAVAAALRQWDLEHGIGT